MITVLRGNSLTLVWTLEGAGVQKGFNDGSLFVYSGIDRRRVDYDIIAENQLRSVIDTSELSQGVYTVEFIWSKSSVWASTFVESVDYRVGTVVLYGKQLYRFVREHAAGSWDDGDVEALRMTYGRVKVQDAFEVTERVSRQTAPSETITVNSLAATIGADGMSAYEIAVLHGYSGSIEEYADLYKTAAELLKNKVEAVDCDEVVEDMEAAVVTDALRKTAQSLSADEKSQARKNIEAAHAHASAYVGDVIAYV